MDPKLNRPFDFGWKREVVHRTNGNAIDIYYHTPENKKLQSKPEVREYLNPRTRLKIDNFTFTRKPLGLDDSKEICRNVYSTERAENSHGGNGISNVENQIVQLTIDEENTNNVQSCSTSTGKIIESDKDSLSETNMRLNSKGRRFQFKKRTDKENQAKPAFLNDIINGKDFTTQFYLDNKTVSNDGTKEDLPSAKSLHRETHYLNDENYINEANELNNSSFKANKLSDLSLVSHVMRDQN